ncbi:MAG: PilZ domain-containing protein [Panacagrimonas sp.]
MNDEVARRPTRPSYRGVLPLAWTPLECPLDESGLNRLHEDNLRVLAATAVLDGGRTLGEDPTPQDIEIERLHQKVDLLIEMTALALGASSALPMAVGVELSAGEAIWEAGSSMPRVGERGTLRLHVHRSVPQPLRLAATIIPAEPGRVRARFDGMAEACQDALERHVFVHHRRAVAVGRQTHRA